MASPVLDADGFHLPGIGMDTCVIPLRHGGLSLVQTTDYIYPIVDDPYMMVSWTQCVFIAGTACPCGWVVAGAYVRLCCFGFCLIIPTAHTWPCVTQEEQGRPSATFVPQCPPPLPMCESTCFGEVLLNPFLSLTFVNFTIPTSG